MVVVSDPVQATDCAVVGTAIRYPTDSRLLR
jgi:hypothetical protein